MKIIDLSGKTALITGASKGIGAEAARIFAGAGANVVLVARGSDAIDALALEIGPQAIAVTGDVAHYWEVEAAVREAEDTFGPIDILINNAGVVEPIGHLADCEPEVWGKTIDINLKGVLHGMRAVMPEMIARGGGTILNISSCAAHGPVEGWSAYCSAKAGAYMLTRMGDKEGREKGVRVIGLSPGTVATDMQRVIKASGINPVSQLEWSDHIPADWPAKCLLWMCSAEADMYLGQDISLREEDVRKAVGLI